MSIHRQLQLIMALSIFAFICALAVLILPGIPSGDSVASKAELSSAISGVFVLLIGILAISLVTTVETSDFKAEQSVKQETGQLLAAMRSIEHKFASSTHMRGAVLDFEKEKEIINNFINSLTALAFQTWISKDVADEQRKKIWRPFFIYLSDLLVTENISPNQASAAGIARSLADLTNRDIRKIATYMSDIADVIEHSTKRENMPIVSQVNADREAEGMDENAIAECFRSLQSNGVNDPDVDLFVAVFDADTEAAKKALEAGANPKVTHIEVLKRHSDQLPASVTDTL